MSRLIAISALPLLLALAVACGDDDDDDAITPDAAPADATPGVDAAGIQPPDTPAGRRLAFVLEALNGKPITADDAAANFTAGFLAQVPAGTLAAIFDDLASDAPWILTGFDGTPTATRLVAVVTRKDGQYARIALTTAPDEADKLQGLLLSPAGDLDPALASFGAVTTAIAGLAPQVNFLAASVDDEGACTPLHELHPEASLAVGSTFKLYVLAALARSIADGERAWTDELAIVDEHKSLPSGELQDAPVGTLLPVQVYAEKMIAISDNTATDHLLFAVGRAQVEAMLAATGHHDPTQNQPFIGTRELFTLKLMLSADEQDAYVAAPIADKRTLLADYAATRDPRTFTGTWPAPIRIDTLEWFATPADLCRVMGRLKEDGEATATAPVFDILSIEPGIPDFQQAFAYVGFKGGSEPGVLNLTWLVRRHDGGYRFLTLGFNDTAKDVPIERIVYVAAAARALLAK